MTFKGQIRTAVALAASTLAAAGPAAAGTPLDGYRDSHERGAVLTSGEAAVAYFRANERATAATSGDAAVAYFRANERATAATSGDAAVAYFRANERATIGTTPISQERAPGDGGFDWGSAAIGASSAVMLALLIGASLLTARRLRGGPMPR